MAGIINVLIQNREIESKNIKTKIAHALWAFCYPAVFWTEVRNEKWIT